MSHKRLDKDNFLEQIVRYGYFAEQFPDCFSSDAFAAHLGVLSKTVAATKAEAGKSRKNTTTPTTLSMYKNDISRRMLSLPNPEAFLRLAKYMQAHWEEVLQFAYSRNSLSPITCINRYDGGSDEIINCESIREKRHAKSDFINGIKQCIRMALGYKYRMKVDITNCYNSIYTHSITWAACGKEQAKSYLRTKTPAEMKDLYETADCLDCFTRFLRNNETNGIVVGPYTSRIVSEIVLARIDKLLAKRGLVFKRYVDDYKMYFRTEAQAQGSLPIIEKVLNEYNLALNSSKTVIEKFPYEVISQIQQTFENALKREGVFGVLNAAAQLHLSGEKGAYKYALKYIRDKEIPHNDLQVIIPTLINIMLLDPKYGKYVTSYLKQNLDSINIDTLTVVINKELASSLHGELQQETLLFVQLIRDLGLNITANNIEGVLLSDNDFAIIIALDIWKNRNKAVVRTRQEARRINDSVKLLAQKLEGEKLSGSRWLLVYETTIHGFLPDYSLKDEDMDDFFKKLKECNITFYNSIKSE